MSNQPAEGKRVVSGSEESYSHFSLSLSPFPSPSPSMFEKLTPRGAGAKRIRNDSFLQEAPHPTKHTLPKKTKKTLKY